MTDFTSKRFKELAGLLTEADAHEESMPEKITLYHGTTPESAESLMSNGWEPGSGYTGGQMGQTRYLYLTSFPENASWYAEEKGSSTVLAVEVSKSDLIVDPEDGVGDTLDDEWINMTQYKMPANFALKRPLPGSAFTLHNS